MLSQDTTILPETLPLTIPSALHNVTYVPDLEYRQQYEFQTNQATEPSWDLNVRLGLSDTAGNTDAAHGGATIYASPPGLVHTSYAILDPDGPVRGAPPAELYKTHPGRFARSEMPFLIYFL